MRKKYGPVLAVLAVLAAVVCGLAGVIVWNQPGELKAVVLVCIFCVLGIVALLVGI